MLSSLLFPQTRDAKISRVRSKPDALAAGYWLHLNAWAVKRMNSCTLTFCVVIDADPLQSRGGDQIRRPPVMRIDSWRRSELSSLCITHDHVDEK